MAVKFTLYILSILVVSSCSPIKKLYVPFSEAKQIHSNHEDEIIRIYFDRMGFIYPDVKISYEDFKNNDGRLNRYYSKNNEVYLKLCQANNVPPLLADMDTIGPGQDPLQKSLIDNYSRIINNTIENKELVFIIHGFNEYPLNARDLGSFEAMKKTRQTITSQVKTKEIQFVEIYWDGLSQEGGAKILSSLNSLKIWNNAQASATNSGLELRRLLANVRKDRVIVFTHSHGAGLVTTALFNVEKFRENLYSKKGHWLNRVKLKYNNTLYDTPKQKFTIGMLAPAIPGVNVFQEYFKRTEFGKNVLTDNKNYRFIIGFNENDPVTSKYGIAARKLGSTTLGCKSKELLQTENLYNDRNVIDHINFSTLSNGLPQDSHSWFSYLDNSSSCKSFIDELFELIK